MSRYARQIPVIGEALQRRMASSSIAVLGAGALGSAISLQLVRMGFGHVRIADFDRIELTNLHRQILFDEADVGSSKLDVVAAKLRRMNSEVIVETFASKVTDDNVGEFVSGVDVVLDATDSVDIRYILNDVCLACEVPLVLSAVAGSIGYVMPVLSDGPCLRCLYPNPPPPEDVANVTSSGLFPPVVLLASSLAVSAAVRIVRGDQDLRGKIFRFDALSGTSRVVSLGVRHECVCRMKRDS